MPGFNGAGPMGQGLMIGGRKGWRNCYYATGLAGWMRSVPFGFAQGRQTSRVLSKDEELAILKNQAGYLKDELDAVCARVQYLESERGEEK